MAHVPSFSLNAVPHDELGGQTKVFNTGEIDYYLHVHIPTEFCHTHACWEIHQVDGDKRELSILDAVEHEGERPWYKVIFSLMDNSPGHHVYRMHMVDKLTNDVMSLYFGYVIQTDNPSKSYVYMK